MELMTAMLLCTLLPILPQALGDYEDRIKKRNVMYRSTSYNALPDNIERTLMLNNEPQQQYKVTPLQPVFMDLTCRACGACMEWALRLQAQERSHVVMRSPNLEEVHYDLMPPEVAPTHQQTLEERSPARRHIVKRDVAEEGESKPKSRQRRHRRSKYVTVTKYNKDGSIYAVKVKETTPLENGGKDVNCQIYKISYGHSCQSAEGEALISVAKSKQEFLKTSSSPKTDTKESLRRNDNTASEQNDNGSESTKDSKESAQSQARERSSRAAELFPRNEESPAGQNPESFMPSIELY